MSHTNRSQLAEQSPKLKSNLEKKWREKVMNLDGKAWGRGFPFIWANESAWVIKVLLHLTLFLTSFPGILQLQRNFTTRSHLTSKLFFSSASNWSCSWLIWPFKWSEICYSYERDAWSLPWSSQLPPRMDNPSRCVFPSTSHINPVLPLTSTNLNHACDSRVPSALLQHSGMGRPPHLDPCLPTPVSSILSPLYTFFFYHSHRMQGGFKSSSGFIVWLYQHHKQGCGGCWIKAKYFVIFILYLNQTKEILMFYFFCEFSY